MHLTSGIIPYYVTKFIGMSQICVSEIAKGLTQILVFGQNFHEITYHKGTSVRLGFDNTNCNLVCASLVGNLSARKSI